MARRQQFLHELLKEDQEPFRLETYIADRRSQLQKLPPPALRRRTALFKHACFLTSPDVRKSPLFEFQRQQPRPKNVGLGLLGSFLKRLKDRSKGSRAVGEEKACDRRPSRTEDKSFDFETSTSSYWSSPFRFNLLRSPPTSARRTPEFCSPATSPCRRVSQVDKENYKPINSNNVQEEEEDKEQCSPVSILDAPFEDDEHASRDEDDGDDDYDNVQRAKQTLLHRLRRFEEIQGSDGEEVEESESLPCGKRSAEPILTQVLNRSSHRGHSGNTSADMKKLVCDLIFEEKSETAGVCDNEAVTRRICKRLDSWGEVELNTVDMMIGFDFKSDHDGWMGFNEQAKEDVPGEIEVAIYSLLVEELSDELLYMDTRHRL